MITREELEQIEKEWAAGMSAKYFGLVLEKLAAALRAAWADRDGWHKLSNEQERREAALASRLSEVEEVPGLFDCKRCGFRLVSQTLYMQSGAVGANRKPQECSNGCGPMWRVSWADHAKDLGSRLNGLVDERDALKARVGKCTCQ